MRPLSLLTVLMLSALIPGALFADGTTLYVHRFLVAGPGDVTLGDLVRTSGATSAQAQEALSRSIAVAGGSLIYVPTDAYRADIDSAFGPGAIVVGRRTTVIPRGSGLETQTWLVDRLIDSLETQGLLASGISEIAVSQVTAKGAPPQDGAPFIQVARNATGAEVTFSLTGSGGGSVSGRLSLASVPPAAAATMLRQGSPVDVVFHKGVITIQMPGRALGTAAVGQSVTVSVAESQKSFTGVVVDGKAVEVDLP
jgi:hypothetical protein